MPLWSNTDDEAGKPKYLSYADKAKTFGVDNTEIKVGSDNVIAVSLVSAGARYVEGQYVTFSGGGGSGAAAGTAGGSANNSALTGIGMINVGSGYTSAPNVVVPLPSRTIMTTFVNTTTDVIYYPNHRLNAGEAVKYFHGGGAPITGLTNNTVYYVSEMGLTSNTFRLATSANAAELRSVNGVSISGTDGAFTCALTLPHLQEGDRLQINSAITGEGTIAGFTPGKIYKVIEPNNSQLGTNSFYLTEEDGTPLVTTIGSLKAFGTGDSDVKTATVINLADLGNNAQYFELQNESNRATAVAVLGSGSNGSATHAGWVKRTVGYGGRAGRVQTEVLVAMGSMTTDNNDDDTAYPDA